MFYNYCPECGTESQPFVSEPNDGTPIRCRYCGTVYRYKTRHWGLQRVIVRLLLLVGIVAFCTKGCFRSETASEREELNSVATQIRGIQLAEETGNPIKLAREGIKVSIGLCNGYEWGSGSFDERRTITRKLWGQLGWDEVKLTYGKNRGGLESFILTRYKMTIEDLKKYCDSMILPWCESAGKNCRKAFKKEGESVMLFLPQNAFGVIAKVKVRKDGKIDLSLSIVNMRMAEVPVDEISLLRYCGYNESENTSQERVDTTYKVYYREN